MVDLTTTYMGMRLKNPIVPSASPLSASLDKVKRMEDAGAAAVVLQENQGGGHQSTFASSRRRRRSSSTDSTRAPAARRGAGRPVG